MDCGAMHFAEFNPLDVLATAASLQSSGARGDGEQDGQTDGDEEAEDGGDDGTGDVNNPSVSMTPATRDPESTEGSIGNKDSGTSVEKSSIFVCPNGTVGTNIPKTNGVNTRRTDKAAMPRVVKVVNSSGSASRGTSSISRPVVTLRDATKVMVTGKDGTYSLMRVNKGQNPDHSYAVYSVLDKPRFDDDEGYCSRSSLGSPGQCWKSDSETMEAEVFDGKDRDDSEPKSLHVVLPEGRSLECLSPAGPSPPLTHRSGGSASLRSPLSGAKLVLSPPIHNKSGPSLLEQTPVSGSPTSVETVAQTKVISGNKKPTKIVIVSRDANIKKLFSHPKDDDGKATTESISSVGSTDSVESINNAEITGKLVDSTVVSDDDVELSPTTGVLSLVASLHDNAEGSNEQQHGGSGTVDEESEQCQDCGKSDQSIEESGHVNVSETNKSNTSDGEQLSTSGSVASNCAEGNVCKTSTDDDQLSHDLSVNESVGRADADVIVLETDSIVPDDGAGKKTNSEPDHGVCVEKAGGVSGVSSVEDMTMDMEPQHHVLSPSSSVQPQSAPPHADISANNGPSLDPDKAGTPVVASSCPSHCMSEVSDTHETASCGNANNNVEDREQPVIHAVSDGSEQLTVVTSGEQKMEPVQGNTHKVLQGLLSVGKDSNKKQQTVQTVLLPSGQLCKLNTVSGSGQTTNKISGQSTAIVNNKAGVVYLVSSSQQSVSLSGTAVDKPQSAVDKSTATNQYIIQDDVPPVAKFYSEPQPVLPAPSKTITSSPTICAVQPKGPTSTSKDNWILLKTNSTTPKGQAANIVTMAPPPIRAVNPGSCAMVPLLVGVSSAPRTKSLLPIVAKPRKSPSCPSLTSRSSLERPLAIKQSSAKTIAIQPKTETTTALSTTSSVSATSLVAIPSTTSVESSQTLSSNVSSERIEPGKGSTSMSRKPEGTSPGVVLDTSTFQQEDGSQDGCTAAGTKAGGDAEDDCHTDEASSGCVTPLTPASGRTTPAYEGRMTPLGFMSSSSDSTPSPSGGKINIKISGGVVVDVRQESGHRDTGCKATRSIGQVGSLSWQGMSSPTPPAENLKTAEPRRTWPKPASSYREAAAHQEARRRHKSKLKAGNPSRAELYKMRESAQSISELHPLIDHDYCTFTEFSADIQSSIIATTDSKLKTERKYIKKPKAARSKSEEEPVLKLSLDVPKLKKRKYTKRKLTQILQRVPKEPVLPLAVTEQSESEDFVNVPVVSEMSPPAGFENKKLRDRKTKRRYRPRTSGDKNYVKIPGSYQDEFVYYATKKTRGRPRKFEGEAQLGIGMGLPKTGIPPATNISEFEWYREMARIDKGTKFGMTNVALGSSVKPPTSLPLPKDMTALGGKSTTPIHESEVVDMVIDMMPEDNMEIAPPSVDSSQILGELMHDEDDQNSMSSLPNRSVASEVQLSTLAPSEESSSSTTRPGLSSSTALPSEEGTVDANLMAEFHRLLNSMEESDQLKILADLNAESQTGSDSKTDLKSNVDSSLKEVSDEPLNNLNAYLSSYSPETTVTETPLNQVSNSQFLDLDEINDSDLLNTGELGNMTAIFGDLGTSSGTASTVGGTGVMSTSVLDSPIKTPSSQYGGFTPDGYSTLETANLAGGQTSRDALGTASPGGNLAAFGRPLDKRELFPDISTPVNPTTTEFSGAPDLTVVNMYWNDLPGLLVNGQEYVRLVDIHKQVLPAKDTGILKKRCQMMGLDIQNCSELQRDFLIRYMNAAKSKSCVIVQKEAAKMLIGFYVDPRPRTTSKQTSLDSVPPSPSCHDDDTSSVDTESLAPAESEVNICDEEGEHQKPSTADGKTGLKSWTMHDYDKQRKQSKSGKSGGDVVKVATPRGRLPSTSRLPASRSKSSPALSSPTLVSPPLSSVDPKRSARLKNKKVQYASLHSEGWAVDEADEEPTERESDAVSQVPPTGPTASSPIVVGPQTITITDSNMVQKTVATISDLADVDVREIKVISITPSRSRKSNSDELELRKLVTKQKKCKLSPKEKRRIHRLREKIRQQKSRTSLEELRRLKQRRERWLKNLEKAKIKRLEEKAKVAKYSREHCYASFQKARRILEAGEGKKHLIPDLSKMVDQGEDVDTTVEMLPTDSVAMTTMDVSEPVTGGNQLVSVQKTEPVSVQVVPVSRPETPSATEDKKVRTLREVTNKTLPVIHRDSVQRGQRGRTQDGTIHLARYVTKEASCVQCNTCQEYLSIKRFLRHRHHMNSPDELVEVSLPQRLELNADSYPNSSPDPDDLSGWAEFTQKRQMFAAAPPVPRRSRKRPRTEEHSHNDSSSPSETPKSRKRVKRQSENTTSKTLETPQRKKQTVAKKPNHDAKGQVDTHMLSPMSVSSDPDVTPENGVRHSSRARKQKQLYPMESYVFARRLSQGETPSKSARLRGRQREKELG